GVGPSRSRPSSDFMRSTVWAIVLSTTRWNSRSSKFFSAFSLSIESAVIEFLRSWPTSEVSRCNAPSSRDRARLSDSCAVAMAAAACPPTVSMSSRSSLVYDSPLRSLPIASSPTSSPPQRSGRITDPSATARDSRSGFARSGGRRGEHSSSELGRVGQAVDPFAPHERDDLLDRVVERAVVGDDDVGVDARRLHVALVRGPHRTRILIQHLLHGATAIREISPDPPDEPEVGRRIDEHLHVQERPERAPPQREQAFD